MKTVRREFHRNLNLKLISHLSVHDLCNTAFLKFAYIHKSLIINKLRLKLSSHVSTSHLKRAFEFEIFRERKKRFSTSRISHLTCTGMLVRNFEEPLRRTKIPIFGRRLILFSPCRGTNTFDIPEKNRKSFCCGFF